MEPAGTAVFRCLAAFGATHLIELGYSAAPPHRRPCDMDCQWNEKQHQKHTYIMLKSEEKAFDVTPKMSGISA